MPLRCLRRYPMIWIDQLLAGPAVDRVGDCWARGAFSNQLTKVRRRVFDGEACSVRGVTSFRGKSFRPRLASAAVGCSSVEGGEISIKASAWWLTPQHAAREEPANAARENTRRLMRARVYRWRARSRGVREARRADGARDRGSAGEAKRPPPPGAISRWWHSLARATR
jgi:hypothetical protein